MHRLLEMDLPEWNTGVDKLRNNHFANTVNSPQPWLGSDNTLPLLGEWLKRKAESFEPLNPDLDPCTASCEGQPWALQRLSILSSPSVLSESPPDFAVWAKTRWRARTALWRWKRSTDQKWYVPVSGDLWHTCFHHFRGLYIDLHSFTEDLS